MEQRTQYGKEAYTLLGGVEGIRVLVNCFYDLMSTMPEAAAIRDMHPKNLQETRENLTLFICGWLGGPLLYLEKHGSVNITELHALLDINVTDRDMWLSCMAQALLQQPIENGLKEYLLQRFKAPAEKIHIHCQQQFMRSTQLKNP